jgi:DNA-binding NarL/FixJ family response regulator
MIRVALVEDNEVFREALEVLLGLTADIRVVASAADGEAASAMCSEHSPDVALVDYRLPGSDGVETIRSILAVRPGTIVLGLTAAADGPQVDAMLEAGATACLGKDRDLDDIISAVRTAVSDRAAAG